MYRNIKYSETKIYTNWDETHQDQQSIHLILNDLEDKKIVVYNFGSD